MKPRSCSGHLLHLFLLLLFQLRLLDASVQQLDRPGQNVTVEKAGTCPDTEVVTGSGNCTEECQSDASCEGIEKCCRTGCGAACRIPNDKPGTCPEISNGRPMLGVCHDECKRDADCSDSKKCCQNGCAKLACATPIF